MENGAAALGEEIKVVRDHAGLSQRQVAETLNYSNSYVGMVETGERLASAEYTEACDVLFGTTGHLSRWRRRLTGGHAGWFIPLVLLEQRAEAVTYWAPSLLPGLLQTSAYATAVYRAAHPREGADEIKSRVEARRERRKLLDRQPEALLWVILSESALRMRVGSSQVMCEQLSSLITDSESTNVELQVLPFSAGAPMAHYEAIFIELPDEPPVLYTEARTGQVHDGPADVADGRRVMEYLRSAALSLPQSLDMIRSAMEAFDSEQHVSRP